MKLPSIQPGMSLVGVEPTQIVSVIAAVKISDAALQIVYRLPDGSIKERLLADADCESISEAVAAHPWRFDGDGEAFKLAVEAKRIDLAFLFDPMMAVHTSNVDPLPHQITAVYESMLPRQPPALRPCRRSRRRQDYHGGSLHSRAHHEGRRQTDSCGSAW